MDPQNYKKVYTKAFDIFSILKMGEKIFENPRLFLLLFHAVKSVEILFVYA